MKLWEHLGWVGGCLGVEPGPVTSRVGSTTQSLRPEGPTACPSHAPLPQHFLPPSALLILGSLSWCLGPLARSHAPLIVKCLWPSAWKQATVRTKEWPVGIVSTSLLVFSGEQHPWRLGISVSLCALLLLSQFGCSTVTLCDPMDC